LVEPFEFALCCSKLCGRLDNWYMIVCLYNFLHLDFFHFQGAYARVMFFSYVITKTFDCSVTSRWSLICQNEHKIVARKVYSHNS
jgi:hypothetical protein